MIDSYTCSLYTDHNVHNDMYYKLSSCRSLYFPFWYLSLSPPSTFVSTSQATSYHFLGGGGGGISQIWFRRGCAAEAKQPVPIFKGHFGGKGSFFWRKRVPIIRGFYSRKWLFLCTLATKWAKISSIYSKITKVGGMFRDFFGKSGGHV